MSSLSLARKCTEKKKSRKKIVRLFLFVSNPNLKCIFCEIPRYMNHLSRQRRNLRIYQNVNISYKDFIILQSLVPNFVRRVYTIYKTIIILAPYHIDDKHKGCVLYDIIMDYNYTIIDIVGHPTMLNHNFSRQSLPLCLFQQYY